MTCFTRYAQDKTVRTTVREGGKTEAAGSTTEVFGIGSGLEGSGWPGRSAVHCGLSLQQVSVTPCWTIPPR